MAATNVPAGRTVSNSTSFILALHARWEAAWEEYNRMDEAQPRKPERPREDLESWQLYHRLEEAMAANQSEVDLLRTTILYQIPADDAELTVLVYHAWGAFSVNPDNPQPEEAKAIEQALISIFDYRVSEGRADMEALGRQFTAAAMIAFKKVRHRMAVQEHLEAA